MKTRAPKSNTQKRDKRRRLTPHSALRTPHSTALSSRDRSTLRRILARYEGARWSPSRSYLPAAVQSARFDAGAATRLELVRKSRYFEKNNALYNRAADLFECYVVGADLQINPASSDTEWNANAKFAWDGWAPLCDLTSRQSFGTLMGLVARTWFVDGEVFILLTRGESGRPRLQLIEGHLVGTPPDLAELEGDRIIDGVQINGNNRPVAYWIASEEAKGKRDWRPVPADFVIHVFEPGRPGQYRGLPFCYPVINDLHDLDDLQLLEMKAARDAAEVTNVIETESGELNDEDLVRQGAAVATQDLNGNSATEQRAHYVRETIGGRTVALRVGEEIKQFTITRPSGATKEYWRCLSEKVCTGMGMPYVIVFPDSMQGTVYRGALDMANAFFRARFQTPAAAARRVYEYVMDYERIATPLLRDPPGDWRNVKVHAPRAVNVDVGRNSTALLAELEAGTRNFDGVYGELGQDYRPELRQKAAEAAYIRTLAAEFKVTPAEISSFGNAPAPGAQSGARAALTPAPAPDDEPVPATP